MRRRTVLLSGVALEGGALNVRIMRSDSESRGPSHAVRFRGGRFRGDCTRGWKSPDGRGRGVWGNGGGPRKSRGGGTRPVRGRDADAIALADLGLVEDLVGWHTTFATNAVTVVYDPDSIHTDAIREDWQSACRRSQKSPEGIETG